MILIANIGVPMIFPQFILMVIAFVPVVLVEALVVRRILHTRLGPAVCDTALANLVTTLLGVPLAWGLMLGLELVTTGGTAWGLATPATRLAAVTLQAAWLIPYEQHLHWMVPAASVVLLIPSFFISIWLERWVLRRRWSERDRPTVNRTVWIANLVSYALLFVAGSIWFGVSSRSNQSPNQALQRTGSAVTAPAADHRRLAAHRQVPRPLRRSLSLGSLGVAGRLL